MSKCIVIRYQTGMILGMNYLFWWYNILWVNEGTNHGVFMYLHHWFHSSLTG